MSYDSRQDTLRHIQTVFRYINTVADQLVDRAHVHDASKLEEPEKSLYDEWTPKLKGLTYGSDEYSEAIAQMGPALQHHYAANLHHPEHYKNGITGMSLLDLVEMLCDWKAASERHADGSLAKSLEINRMRFNISDQLAAILENTCKELGW